MPGPGAVATGCVSAGVNGIGIISVPKRAKHIGQSRGVAAAHLLLQKLGNSLLAI